MKKTPYTNGIDWLEFDDPEEEHVTWRVQLNFLMSNWKCLFGNGCPGLFAVNDSTVNPDTACCVHGAWFHDRDDYQQVAKRVEQLTSEDWDDELRKVVDKKGWAFITKDNPPYDEADDTEDDFEGRTRVHDKGCVFSNRANGSVGSTGKTGCAFLHLGNRLNANKHDIEDNSQEHEQFMPRVCWQVPLQMTYHEDETRQVEVRSVFAFDIDVWGVRDEDGTHDSTIAWWCTETPDAYIGTRMVYQSMERELRRMMGDKPYDRMVQLIQERKPTPAPMPGAVINEGRPLIPLIVGNRKPRRVAP
ncbi:hypothetical protein ABZV93_18545 [Actinopolymorpha sp. NPDC004070]|uniref:hypothetical protein n=1 Tax=Actinopolymorpha sp. NPDC004070 TaxID=3154548 RepID=UPI0033AF0E46